MFGTKSSLEDQSTVLNLMASEIYYNKKNQNNQNNDRIDMKNNNINIINHNDNNNNNCLQLTKNKKRIQSAKIFTNTSNIRRLLKF